MEIITQTTKFHIQEETAVAIGKFDGIHLGHQKLIQEIMDSRKRGLKTVIFTFSPPPAVVLFGQPNLELTSLGEKRLLFEKMGIDYLIEFPLDKITIAIEPERYLREYLAEKIRAKYIVAGTDISFGDKGTGNIETLCRFAKELSYDVKVIDKVCIDGLEVSSTVIREFVGAGNIRKAAEFLGNPYFIAGKVKHGAGLGRTLGFPTVNLVPHADKLLPPKGVYYSKVLVEGREYRGITNIGTKPTVDNSKAMGVETYIYDFQKDVYGKNIVVALLDFKREERKFQDVEALKAQLRLDILDGREYFLQNSGKKVQKLCSFL